jgi:hypothetical protein
MLRSGSLRRKLFLLACKCMAVVKCGVLDCCGQAGVLWLAVYTSLAISDGLSML